MSSFPELQIDPSNTDQLSAWDGDEGAFWAGHPDQFDRGVAAHSSLLFEAAQIGESDQVLDIGCGTGETTREAARRARSGAALGVDLSAQMLAVARKETDRLGLDNARFEQGDAQVHGFAAATYDIAISRAGVMFFGDPVAAFANIARALRPEGRLALVVWQELRANEWISAVRDALAAGRDLPSPPPDAPGPFSMADPERVRDVLTRAGFVDVHLTDVAAPLDFGQDTDEAYRFLSGFLAWMLKDLDDSERAGALSALRSTLEEHATDQGVVFGSAAWLITARRG